MKFSIHVTMSYLAAGNGNPDKSGGLNRKRLVLHVPPRTPPPERGKEGTDLQTLSWVRLWCRCRIFPRAVRDVTGLALRGSRGWTSPGPGPSAPLPRDLLTGPFGNLGQAVSPIPWGSLVFHSYRYYIYKLVDKAICYTLVFSMHCGEMLMRIILQFVSYLFAFFSYSMNFHNHVKFALIEVFSD